MINREYYSTALYSTSVCALLITIQSEKKSHWIPVEEGPHKVMTKGFPKKQNKFCRRKEEIIPYSFVTIFEHPAAGRYSAIACGSRSIFVRLHHFLDRFDDGFTTGRAAVVKSKRQVMRAADRGIMFDLRQHQMITACGE